jgi:8-oxo-dGTP pyrophosphatase MutT (NUDIX family)
MMKAPSDSSSLGSGPRVVFAANGLRSWRRHAQEIVYKTRVFDVLKQRMSIEDRPPSDFFTLQAPDWINVIATTTEGEVVLVNQYRHGIEEASLEIPGGVIDAEDADPLTAAKRELLEETGFHTKAGNWHNLGHISSNPALFNNYCHVFYAEACTRAGAQQLDMHEDIEVRLLSAQDFSKAVREGQIHHALAVAAVARLLLFRPSALS